MSTEATAQALADIAIDPLESTVEVGATFSVDVVIQVVQTDPSEPD